MALRALLSGSAGRVTLRGASGRRAYFGLDAATRQHDAGWVLLRSFKRQLATLGPESWVALDTGSVTALELLTAFLVQLRRDLAARSNLRPKPQEAVEAVIELERETLTIVGCQQDLGIEPCLF